MPYTHSNTLNLAIALIARPSVTPKDKGCQDLLIDQLKSSGFVAEKMNFGQVENVWLRKGSEAPLFCFAGHTDVVPAGPFDEWDSDPFEAVIRDGKLYGRGTADMKGGIAAFTVACQRFIKDYPDHKGSIAYLITSDEEGPATDGTVKVIETLEADRKSVV